MTISGWAMILLFTVLFVALAKPMGAWLFALYGGQKMPMARVIGPVEQGFYKLSGVDATREQSWVGYAVSLLMFNLAGIVLLFAILKLQGGLPLNPQDFDGMESWLAFNTAVSFVTNTNWQNYGGETTLSHFSQMAGLTVQNFLSAATGLAVAFAFIRALRGRARKASATSGQMLRAGHSICCCLPASF